MIKTSFFLFMFFGMISVAYSKSVLIVLSGESHLILKNKKTFSTGFYLNELMIPVRELAKNNYQLIFATPKGIVPTLDKSSDHPKYFSNKEEYREAKVLLGNLKLTDASLSPVVSLDKVVKTGIKDFSGIFIPGGHAPMVDLAFDPNLGDILKEFHNSQKPTALICHGPVALLSTLENPRKVVLNKGSFSTWIYKDYKMTVFSDNEESYVEETKLGGKVPFSPESTLKKVGGNVSTAANWKSHVIIDRELITGQNPASDKEAIKVFIKLMEK